MNSITQEVTLSDFQVRLFMMREDLIHPLISGNKYRKLKYNIDHALKHGYDTLVTFGGAYSNHILAVAAVGQKYGFRTVGCIRGDELTSEWEKNPTLCEAKLLGMNFEFLSRENYRLKEHSEQMQMLVSTYPLSYIIPEGGTNELAVRGCEEILSVDEESFDYITVPVGTGGTISGIINASTSQQILGFPVLKGDFLREDICKFVHKNNWSLIPQYHFGGYGKVTSELVDFLNHFYQKYQIPLDPIYTGKMVFGVFDLIQKGFFPKESKILMIHTGGIQGIRGVNQYLKKTNKSTIVYAE